MAADQKEMGSIKIDGWIQLTVKIVLEYRCYLKQNFTEKF